MLASMNKVGIIGVERENGLFRFGIKNIELIDSDVNKYKIIDLSLVNCMDDIIAVLMDSEYTSITVFCNKENFIVIKSLSEKIISEKLPFELNWIINDLKESFYLKVNESKIWCFPSLKEFEVSNKKDLRYYEESYFEKIFKEDKKVNNYSKDFFRAMDFGLRAFITGKYPIDFKSTMAKHVYIDNLKMLDEINLSDYMDINSAVFMKVDDYDDKIFNEKCDKYYNHIHQINKERVYFDDSNMHSGFKVESYSDFFKNIDSSGKNLKFLTIRNNEDINCFIKHVQLFEKSGSLDNPNFYLVDECRYINRCSLSYQVRFCLKEGTKVAPCLDSAVTLYDISEDEYEKYRIRSQHIDTCILARKCKDCKARIYCSQCSMLPTGISEEQYCNMMINNPLILDYLDIKNVIILLSEFSSLFNVYDNDIKFSNRGYSMIFSNNLKNKNKNRLTIYLFSKDDKYYLFNIMKNRILRVKEPLVFIIEGIIKGYDESEIGEYFNEYFRKDELVNNFLQGWNLASSLIK